MQRSKGRRNEQVARTEAECQMEDEEREDGLCSDAVDDRDAIGVSASFPPSFLVHNSANVNAQLHRARGLLTMWDFLEYKGRIGRRQVVLTLRELPRVVRIMPGKCRSRYFEEGRWYMSRRIMKRLGRYERLPGLMETLTYDPKKIGKQEAWAGFGRDTRRFLNAVNQYRKRRGWRRTHYFWVVEVQRGTGYPHIHIFFPNLRFLAPLHVLNGNWRQGRANVETPRRIKVSCAGYISKYLRKMEGWSDLHLALLWSGHSRMYGFSRGFLARAEEEKSEWQVWCAFEGIKDLEVFEKSLEEGGFAVDRGQFRRGNGGWRSA